jgi:predicted PurR-regulated permease PerM
LHFGQWIGFILLILLGFELWQARQLVLLLFMAIVLANGLTLLIRRFQRWGLQRSQAVLLAIISLFLGLASFIALIVPPFVVQFEQLARLVPRGIEQFWLWVDRLIEHLDPSLVAALPNLKTVTEPLQPLINDFLGRSFTVFYGSLGSLLSLLLLLVLTMMLLADPEPYRRGFIRLFPAYYRGRIEGILLDCERSLQDWLAGMVVNMVIVAIVTWIGLLMFQVPLALSQAILTGLFAFIPMLGLLISAISPLAITLLQDPWKFWAVLLFYLGMQLLESQYLTPRLMRQQMSFLPGIMLFFQVVLTIFFGFFGLCLAVPLSLIGQIWIREILVRDILDRWILDRRELRSPMPSQPVPSQPVPSPDEAAIASDPKPQDDGD